MSIERPLQPIEDPAKAEEMARAGKVRRDTAALRRAHPDPEKASIEGLADAMGEKSEQEAGEEYDERKRLEAMSDDEIQAEICRSYVTVRIGPAILKERAEEKE